MEKDSNNKDSQQPQSHLSEVPLEELLSMPAAHAAAMNMVSKYLQKSRGRQEEAKEEVEGEKEEVDPAGEPNDDIDGAAAGVAVVKELLNRCDRGRPKEKKHEASLLRELLSDDSDLSELEADWQVMQEDMRREKMGTNPYSFLEDIVPQYELKKKIYEKHCSVIENMTGEKLFELLNSIMTDLRAVKEGLLVCRRHQKFQELSQIRNGMASMEVGEPFTEAQRTEIAYIIEARLLRGQDMLANNGKLTFYLSTVLVPEACARIFAKANKIDLEFAEKELQHQAKYDGCLTDDMVESLMGEADEEKQEDSIDYYQ